MQTHLVLSQTELGKDLLEEWCRAATNSDAAVNSAVLMVDGEVGGYEAATAYNRMVARIAPHIQSSDFEAEGLTIVVDSVDVNEMSLVSEKPTWENVIAMLILTFPEAQWIFGVATRLNFINGDGSESFPVKLHRLNSLFDSWQCSLFDPTGIRNWIRTTTNLDLTTMANSAEDPDSAFQLPVREMTAAVIEDEDDFATLHGYAAYRYGFRAELITSWEKMKDRFCCSSPDSFTTHQFDLLLEDMRLQFADKPANVKLSNLIERGEKCNQLADEHDHSKWRFLITTGQEGLGKSEVVDNDGFLFNRRHGTGKLLTKPIGGPIELWEKTGLQKELTSLEETTLPRGNALGFVWPPNASMDETYSGHAAPGKLALVAKTLLARARTAASSAETPRDWIKVAVLSGDALELIGGKTPALALDALKMKHSAEVRAECAFVGAGFHCDLKRRFTELDQEIQAICRWYDDRQQKRCGWDAKATILNELIRIYRECGQMEEENKCLAAFRLANRRLERPKGGWRFNPFSWFLHGVLAYAEMLMAEFWRLLLALSLWIGFFVLLSYWMTDQSSPFIYLAQQLNSMVGGGTHNPGIVEAKHGPYAMTLVGISIASSIVGVFHFGILMSYLYSLISRK